MFHRTVSRVSVKHGNFVKIPIGLFHSQRSMHDDILSYMLMFLLAKFAHMTLQFTFGVLNQLARAFFGETLKVVILFTQPLHFMEKTLAIKLVKHARHARFARSLV